MIRFFRSQTIGKRVALGCLLAIVAAVLVLLSFRSGEHGPGGLARSAGYNILLISIDALRADHLGCYGYRRNTSPNLDAFAAKSLLFTRFFTVVPKTGPSMTSFFTGRYIHNHGVVTNKLRRDPSIATLTQLLPEHMNKAAFILNPALAKERGYADGFDTYTLLYGPQEALTKRAISWLKGNASSSAFFLWLHFMDPHGPYKPPPEFSKMFLGDEHYDPSKKVHRDYVQEPGVDDNAVLGAIPRYQRVKNIDEVDYYIAQYDAETRHTDDEIGKVLRFVERAGLAESTIIIVTADHGESLGEHDYYFEHGMLVNEGSIYIPLIIGHPEVTEARRIDALLQNTDLAPTILSEFGLSFGEEIDGTDFSSLYRGGASDRRLREFVYSCTPHDYEVFVETVRTERYKLVRKDEGQFACYDLRKDRLEEWDVFAEMDRALIAAEIDVIGRFGRITKRKAHEVELSGEMLRRLLALGYVE